MVLQVVPVGSSGFNFTHDRNFQKNRESYQDLFYRAKRGTKNLEKPPAGLLKKRAMEAFSFYCGQNTDMVYLII